MSETSVLLKEADESISSGEWDQAIEKLEELTRSEVKTSDVFRKLAQANAVRGRFLTVLSVYLEWTDSALESGDIEQAEKALGYAQSLRPGSPEVQEAGLKVARLKLEPEALADQLIALAHLHLEKGDPDRSVALVKEAVEVKPDDESLTLQLGEVYISVGQIGSGLKIFEDFVKKHSDCGEPSKLLEPLRRINLLKADDIESTLHLGRVYLALEQVDKAEEQFRAVLRLDLENQDALLELARVCQKKGLFRNGLLALNRVAQLNPELPIPRRLMGELHLAAGSPKKAVKELLEAARLYSEADESDHMVEVYRTILRFDQNPEALSHLRNLSFSERYNEDLTANLFAPVEDELAETQAPEAKVEPPEELPEPLRPEPIAPMSGERNEMFEEVDLIEHEPEHVESRLTPKRPALVRKRELTKGEAAKPTLLPSGRRKKATENLRRGLGRKDGNSGKKFLTRTKPLLPAREEVAPPPTPEELVDPPLVVAQPIGPRESPLEETHIQAEKVPTPQQAIDEIPPFEEVFEKDTAEQNNTETDVCNETNEPRDDLSAPQPPAVPAEMRGSDPVDPEVLFPDDDDIFRDFEKLEQDSLFNQSEDWGDREFTGENVLLTTVGETGSNDDKESETISDEPSPGATQDEVLESLTAEEAGRDLSWLFETDDLEDQEAPPEVAHQVPENVESPLQPTPEEPTCFGPVSETSVENKAPTKDLSDSENSDNDLNKKAYPDPDFGRDISQTELSETAPTPLVGTEKILESESVVEDEPLFQVAEDDTLFPVAEDEPLFPVAEDEPLFPVVEDEPFPLFTTNELLSPIDHGEPNLAKEEEEPGSATTPLEKLGGTNVSVVDSIKKVESEAALDFQTLRDREISLLADQSVLNPETPELIQILQETLPVSQKMPMTDKESTDTVSKIEPEPEEESQVEIELTQQVPPEDSVQVEPVVGDVATRIGAYRSHLETFPTDEKTTLFLADTCLQYGMLEHALVHYRRLQSANPSCPTTSARIIKAALWMEDITTVKRELWRAANLSFDMGDLKTCQDRLGDLLSLDCEHKDARQLMVEVFLAGGQEKLAAWHLSQMVERAVSEQEYELAIRSLKRLHEVSPSDAALEKLGELYQKQHQTEEALEIFRRLRSSHITSKDSTDAVRLARQVVELEPERTDDREVLIDLLIREGRPSEVTEQRIKLAVLYRDQARVGKAVALLQGVLAEEPDHLDAERLLVELHIQNGSIELAEQHAETLAERFLEQKAYEKAIDLFEYWVGAAPSAPRTRERLAQFYQLNGDLEGAKMEWLVVTESHHAAGDFQRAARSLERALELEPQNNEWRLRLAQLKARELDQVDSALQDFRILFQADPTWRKATVGFLELLMEHNRMTELGEVLQVLERVSPGSNLVDNVVSKLKQKMAAEPDNLVLSFGWGELCLALGMLDLAIEQFQRLRRHEEYQLHSYRLLGLCFSRKKGFNMVELALSQFRRGLDLKGGSARDRLELRYDLAAVLREHGRIEEALEQLNQIAQEEPGYRDVEMLVAELQS